MKKKLLTALRILMPVLMIVSVAALGIEMIARDAENLAAITVWGIVALTALSGNAALVIQRLFVKGGVRERQIALLLIMLVLGIYTGALVRVLG